MCVAEASAAIAEALRKMLRKRRIISFPPQTKKQNSAVVGGIDFLILWSVKEPLVVCSRFHIPWVFVCKNKTEIWSKHKILRNPHDIPIDLQIYDNPVLFSRKAFPQLEFSWKAYEAGFYGNFPGFKPWTPLKADGYGTGWKWMEKLGKPSIFFGRPCSLRKNPKRCTFGSHLFIFACWC